MTDILVVSDIWHTRRKNERKPLGSGLDDRWGYCREVLLNPSGSCPPVTSYMTPFQDLKKQSNQQIREVALTQSEAVQRLTEGAEKRETALKVG